MSQARFRAIGDRVLYNLGAHGRRGLTWCDDAAYSSAAGRHHLTVVQRWSRDGTLTTVFRSKHGCFAAGFLRCSGDRLTMGDRTTRSPHHYAERVTEFAGFPVAALDFYDDLEVDNTKSYWEKHKATYDEAVKAPITALVTTLAPEFALDGQSPKIFRPYRDVRFAKDKTPYKTNQGAYVAVAPATGWYVEISARGVRTGGGCYDLSGERLAAYRDAVADDKTGPRLARVVRKLEKAGWEIGGNKLKTAPRGYDADHPRIDLMRHKQLFAGRSHGFEPIIHTPALLEQLRTDWRALRPLIDWLGEATSA